MASTLQPVIHLLPHVMSNYLHTKCSCPRETRDKLRLSDHCIPDRMRTESFKYNGGP